MKAVILAGGEGTRLRPLTLGTPKPVVPVVDRPFLRHQLDLLARAGIHDVVFSVAYQPEKVRAAFGNGSGTATRITYEVEQVPLGTGGAVKRAEPLLDDLTIVLNGDILTDVDLGRVIAEHRSSGARATLVLTPVANPSAFGLVETDPTGRVVRFVEKPDPSQITTDTINAGIYVLDTRTLSLLAPAVPLSIERAFFPALIARGDLVRAHVHRGYWIDIGTPEKYLEVSRDILRGRFPVALEGQATSGGWIHASARVDPGVELEPPFFVGPRCRLEAECHLGPDAVLVSDVGLGVGARVRESVLWAGCSIGPGTRIDGALLGTGVWAGHDCTIRPGSVLGEGTRFSDLSRGA